MNCFYLDFLSFFLILFFFCVLVLSSNSQFYEEPKAHCSYYNWMTHSSRLLRYTIHGNVFISLSILNLANFISYAFYLFVSWLPIHLPPIHTFDSGCVRFFLVCSISHVLKIFNFSFWCSCFRLCAVLVCVWFSCQ